MRNTNKNIRQEVAKKNRGKLGFTIVELMVVIIIVNLLSGVAIPKLTGLIERTRQKVDLMRLYHLRDALNRALYETDIYTNDGTVGTSGCKDISGDNMDTYLRDARGMLLFVVEQNSVWEVNYQGSGKGAGTNNMCGLMIAGGFWSTAFKDAGFGAISDIINARAHGDDFTTYASPTYVAKQLSNGWWRTYPTEPIFISRFMNNDRSTGTNQTRFAMKVQWTGRNPESRSIEVFFAEDTKTWQESLLSRQGVCFSTYGQAGCKNSTAK